MSLLDPADATHVAVRDGAWSDPATWQGGRIPGPEADVNIPAGITVEYDIVSDTPLNIVRVDGTLNWATNKDTGMLVETIIGSHMSHISIGSEGNPVDGDVSAEIVFRDTSINLSDDPTQTGNGLVTMGSIEVSGAPQEMCLGLVEDAPAGATRVKVGGDLTNWNVGDTVVLMGTEGGEQSGGRWVSEDEERVITAINPDGTLTLDRPLQYSHAKEAGFEDQLNIPVGNATRNVVFSSENPEGTRGHVMIMSDEADIRFAEFHELGRTDTSIERETADNPIGRYALHLHKTGLGEDDGTINIIGNAVNGGPGWGIVQHESKANIDWNFVYDVAGAGIVSETGNETGQWIGNFVSSIYGDGERVDHVRDELEGDFGHAGVAYESQSRLVIQQDNLASGSRYGWTFRANERFKTDDDFEEIELNPADVQFNPDPLGQQLVSEEVQIMGFTGNTVVAAESGLSSGHRVNIHQETDLHSQIFDFTAWNVRRGLDLINYTGNYVVKDSLFINGFQAIALPGKHEGTNVIDTTIANFNVGIFNQGFNHTGVLVDVDFIDVDQNVQDLTDRTSVVLNGSQLNYVDKPIIRFDSDSDLVLDSNRGHSLFFSGTITDSAGTYRFSEGEWRDQPRSIVDGYSATFNSGNWMSVDEVLGLYGTMRDDNGDWILPVIFWISDRVTGEAHPFMVPVKIENYSDEYLESFELDSFELPSAEIEIVDTKVDPSNPGSGSNPGPQPEDPAPDETPTDGGAGGAGNGNSDGGSNSGGSNNGGSNNGGSNNGGSNNGGSGNDGSDRSDPVETITPVFRVNGDHQFNGGAASVKNYNHRAAYEVSDTSITFSFNADRVDGTQGLVSKDSQQYSGGGNHVSVYIWRGDLIARVQSADDERFLRFDNLVANRDYAVRLDLGPDGVALYVNGALIVEDDTIGVDLSANEQNLQLGALGWSSADGAGDFSSIFRGTISDFALNERSTTDDGGNNNEEAEQGDDRANDLTGTSGDDVILAGGGNDKIRDTEGNDTVDGGEGIDLIDYSQAAARVRLDLMDATRNTGAAAEDTLISIESAIGSNYRDDLRGDDGKNVFFGGGASDRLYGRAGSDTLDGGAGFDHLIGGNGRDTMTGGLGDDRFVFQNISQSSRFADRDVITDFTEDDVIDLYRIDANKGVGGNQVFNFIGEDAFSGAAGELRYVSHVDMNMVVVHADVDGDKVSDFSIKVLDQLSLDAEDFLL
ncbi:MAG: G8 domain-containing protein [Pseudomonadota bacterium]